MLSQTSFKVLQPKLLIQILSLVCVWGGGDFERGKNSIYFNPILLQNMTTYVVCYYVDSCCNEVSVTNGGGMR